MIKVDYNREKNSTIISVGNLNSFGIVGNVRVKLKNVISGQIHNVYELSSNMWAYWQGAELITDVLVYDSKDKLIQEFKWEVWRHGDEIEKALWFYLKYRKENNISSNGLVIGTHDGRNGHWIYPIKENLSKATLIDGSPEQFIKLQENYRMSNNCTMINDIVTVDGGEVTWFQGGEGYTDTVVESLIKDWLVEEKIRTTKRNSISFKKLINDNDFDWIHLDVEGIDDDLILSLDKRPNIIIFESMNLSKERMDRINLWFQEKGYDTITTNGNTLASKK
jgi:hypothetical protein